MKKIMIFLMTVFGIGIFSLVNVNAETYNFYEGDYIDGIWITKEKGGTKYYQKARFFMQSNRPGRFAYCIEPFEMFDEESSYSRSVNPNTLSDEQKTRLKLIAYFGYNYQNHTDPKWYAISQYMIWKEADPTGDIYFTDSLNGNRIEAFANEINEINALINNYYTLPSIANMEVNMVENSSITLTDTNNVLSNYTSNNPDAYINGNTLTINNLKEGEYTIDLIRDMKKYDLPPIFYHASFSQDMMTVGDIKNINISLKVNVDKTTLDITKIDSDTKTTIPSGEASLSGAIYQIYDSNMKEIEKLEIDDNMKASIENLDYGKYYIKEISAGEGYLLDENTYEFEITHDNKNIVLELENKVIKKEIIIHKTYGDGINGNNEKDISFDIYNKKGELITTITTDNNGYAKVILPFGVYTFKQNNTTDGYTYADDFTIDIKNEDKEEINLYDYKIKVPNTSKNSPIFITILVLLMSGSIVKKYIFN